eukprot:1176047-Prorocentrum_minimum.AAC.3
MSQRGGFGPQDEVEGRAHDHDAQVRMKWKAGDMIKMPKFLGKEGRERRRERGKAVTKTLKWDHIGTRCGVRTMQVGPHRHRVREGDGSCHKGAVRILAATGTEGPVETSEVISLVCHVHVPGGQAHAEGDAQRGRAARG